MSNKPFSSFIRFSDNLASQKWKIVVKSSLKMLTAFSTNLSYRYGDFLSMPFFAAELVAEGFFLDRKDLLFKISGKLQKGEKVCQSRPRFNYQFTFVVGFLAASSMSFSTLFSHSKFVRQARTRSIIGSWDRPESCYWALRKDFKRTFSGSSLGLQLKESEMKNIVVNWTMKANGRKLKKGKPDKALRKCSSSGFRSWVCRNHRGIQEESKLFCFIHESEMEKRKFNFFPISISSFNTENFKNSLAGRKRHKSEQQFLCWQGLLSLFLLLPQLVCFP